MRVNLPVTSSEYQLAPDAALVSRTDLKGRITYANPAFVEASGFPMEELIGKAHGMLADERAVAHHHRDRTDDPRVGDGGIEDASDSSCG